MSNEAMTRRTFAARGAIAAAATAVGARVAQVVAAAEEDTNVGREPKPKGPLVRIGFHTDAFNSAYFNFEKCLQWAQQNGVHYIECGLMDGVSWAHGLGYWPHIAMYEDPLMLRRKMETYGVQFSQVDAAYPLSGKDGPLRGVPYVLKAIAWADQAGCPRVDTTDGLHAPPGLKDEEAMDLMKRSYQQIIEVAEAHKIIVNIEPHGYFTTKPELMARMLAFCDTPYLRMNMDTGNTFIAGQDPVAFVGRFVDRINHVHVKDVSSSLAAVTRGKQTGIPVSHCALGCCATTATTAS
jgi:sugar phosphate isomerase/epimerase